jgi:g-D-glutamyl-meso-diaminopimelate peptidase
MNFEKLPTQLIRNQFYKKIKKNNDIKHKIISKSLCKRNIDAFQFKAKNSTNSILLSGGFHGSEWLTILILIKFMFDLINNSKNLNNQITKNVVIVPCVNPDGTEIAINGANAAQQFNKLITKISRSNTSIWKSNARGVDINHNFNAGWQKLKKLEIKSGITGPASTRYGGEFPESEPETKAIANFSRICNFSYALAFHSQGEEIYWSYGDVLPESRQIADIFSNISGYKLNEPEEDLAIGGGFKDWFITEMKRPAFTIEIGRGKNPLPLSKFISIYKKIEKMLWLAVKI